MKQSINYMIGDWIMVKGKSQQIAAIHQKKLGYHESPGRLSWVRLDQIQVIPLTSDFLVKNGFRRDGNYYTLKIVTEDSSFYIALEDLYEDGKWDMTVRNYSKLEDNYTKKELRGRLLKVHQIQHEFMVEEVKKEFVM